jgi:hypothetical protein
MSKPCKGFDRATKKGAIGALFCGKSQVASGKENPPPTLALPHEGGYLRGFPCHLRLATSHLQPPAVQRPVTQ